VFTSSNASEIAIVIEKLSEEGISYFKDVEKAATDLKTPLMSVKVKSKDLEKAKRVIEKIEL
ncbi:MAG: hypothetical protein LRY73_12120, partial [Bacillus sp. (in: Bacteria)]|nr:hypothetical protein [Bacillus sp. (in: firmicutes)]